MIFCCCFKKENNVVFELVKESQILPSGELNLKSGIARARHLANKPQRESTSGNNEFLNYDMGVTIEQNSKDTTKANKHPYTQIADETQQIEIPKIDVLSSYES